MVSDKTVLAEFRTLSEGTFMELLTTSQLLRPLPWPAAEVTFSDGGPLITLDIMEGPDVVADELVEAGMAAIMPPVLLAIIVRLISNEHAN
jgi:hypothetical protein